MGKMKICNSVLAQLYIYKLVTVYCDISVSAFNVDKVTVLMTFPVETYLVEIQEKMLIPKFIVPITPSTLELIIWATNWFAKIATDGLSIIVFINVHNLIRPYLNIPMTSATAEGTFSTLCKLKNYLQSTMTQEQLTISCCYNT